MSITYASSINDIFQPKQDRWLVCACMGGRGGLFSTFDLVLGKRIGNFVKAIFASEVFIFF